METKEGELLTIGEVIRLGLAKKWKIAIYGSEKEETASYDTEGEKSFESITSMNGGKVKYRVKSFDEAEKILSVILEVT
ncbi:hypothetical protein C5S31_01465 [ANME-1 cluster archaeon GoMg2]|nr:hypothetical protein [ANME-1 cluster archaeon GoMg2]